MNVLIDIVHPAHVHLLKNVYFQLTKKGHKVFVTVKNINSAKTLLEKNDIPHKVIGFKKDSLWSKAIGQIYFNFVWLGYIRKHKINIGIGSSLTIAHLSKLSDFQSIMLDDDDDEVEPLLVRFAHPFASVVLSPSCTSRKIASRVPYDGYHELAYLHPNRFLPDPTVLSEIGIDEAEKYFVLRFNAFKAHHDVGVLGLSQENKRKLISMLEKQGRVFITTEREIDPEFEKYKLKLSPEKVHSLIYYATMLIGDSQTMTSEAAVLGTPAIRSNSFVGRISYLEEEEHKYGLTFGFKPEETNQMFEKIQELLEMNNLKEEWQKRRSIMLSDKIDVTSFFVWFIENYPESVKILKSYPDYQYNFK